MAHTNFAEWAAGWGKFWGFLVTFQNLTHVINFHIYILFDIKIIHNQEDNGWSKLKNLNSHQFFTFQMSFIRSIFSWLRQEQHLIISKPQLMHRRRWLLNSWQILGIWNSYHKYCSMESKQFQNPRDITNIIDKFDKQ